MRIKIKLIPVQSISKEELLGVFGTDYFKIRIFLDGDIENVIKNFFLSRYLIYPHSYKIISITKQKNYYMSELEIDDRSYEILMSDVEK